MKLKDIKNERKSLKDFTAFIEGRTIGKTIDEIKNLLIFLK